jgi:hypothetical protein
MGNILAANLYFASAERQRQLNEQEARERGFNSTFGNDTQEYTQAGGSKGGANNPIPYFLKR